MDVYESEQALRKHTRIDTPRPPLVPAEKNNAINTVPTIRPSRTREVSSRYKSPSVNRRCSSPNITRTPSSPSASPSSHAQLVSKRAVSADRKRPSTPPSPSNISSTLVNESSRRMSTGGKLPESLWPSTMRSLSVSFQSDTISIPISKKEKSVTNVTLDRTLRPALNVAHKQPETPSALSRKPTPERKRSPLKGKNAPDQSENSKPIDGLSTRLIDQHRWPSRIGGKVSSNALTKSMDHPDKVVRNSVSSVSASGLSSLRRTTTPVSENSLSKSLQKSISDSATRLLSSLDESVDYNSSRFSGPKKLISTTSSDRSTSAAPAARSQSLPLPGSRLPSPSRTSFLSSSRGVSPARGRPSTPPCRGVSPSRTMSSTMSSNHQSTSSASVLSFIADVKKGRKSASYIDDAHQLRLLYNRYLQWRFANARAEAVLYVQQVTAEEILYNVLNATLSLWDSVVRKRINLQQLNLQLKLNSVLSDQMAYLDDWASLERDHVSSLSGIVEDLEASTLRVPLTGGAKADIESLNAAICSAVDVMKAMGSSICSLLSKAEDMNSLVSELAVLTTQEKTMLDECEAMLASSAAMQVEEYSLRTNLIQMKPASGGGRRRRRR